MLRDMLSFQKNRSQSCPADFNGNEIVNDQSRTPPVSNGSRSRYQKRSSGSKNPSSYGMNGNHRPVTMNVTMTSPRSTGIPYNPDKAVPGRPRRRGNATPTSIPKRKKHSKSIRSRLMSSRWMNNPMQSSSSIASLVVAVFLWYMLGVVSITTSNLLMMEPQDHIGGIPPLYLTLQQLVIGATLLRFLLHVRFLGSPGIQPWPSPSAAAAQAAETRRRNLLFNDLNSSKSRALWSDLISSNLVLAGVFFAMGFLATNSGFLASSAAFVETVKAAEPITSAVVAVMWRIEALSAQETLSLGTIVTGVVISTFAHSATKAAGAATVSASLMQSLKSCAVVMTSNLCFSFRGLYQKLFRASPEGSAQVIDDLNLQLRMQQIGVVLLVVPVVLLDLPRMFANVWDLTFEVGLLRSGLLFRYLSLALVNGIAFTSYNLASTYILTRISVVHHAALNCIRRIFAIIVTSLFFNIPITLMGAMGFIVSFGGFMSFTHFKIQRQKQPKPLSSLLPVSAAVEDK